MGDTPAPAPKAKKRPKKEYRLGAYLEGFIQATSYVYPAGAVPNSQRFEADWNVAMRGSLQLDGPEPLKAVGKEASPTTFTVQSMETMTREELLRDTAALLKTKEGYYILGWRRADAGLTANAKQFPYIAIPLNRLGRYHPKKGMVRKAIEQSPAGVYTSELPRSGQPGCGATLVDGRLIPWDIRFVLMALRYDPARPVSPASPAPAQKPKRAPRAKRIKKDAATPETPAEEPQRPVPTFDELLALAQAAEPRLIVPRVERGAIPPREPIPLPLALVQALNQPRIASLPAQAKNEPFEALIDRSRSFREWPIANEVGVAAILKAIKSGDAGSLTVADEGTIAHALNLAGSLDELALLVMSEALDVDRRSHVQIGEELALAQVAEALCGNEAQFNGTADVLSDGVRVMHNCQAIVQELGQVRPAAVTKEQ